MKKIYRHGDLLIRKIDEINGEQIGQNKYVLAEGETTGHMHTIEGKGVRVYAGKNGMMQIQVEKTAELSHQEHATIELPAGNYEVLRQREYDIVQGVRQVLD